MWVTRPLARGFDPARIKDPERSGAVDWALFNANFERFLNTPWWRVNQGHRGPAWLRALRLGIAYAQQRRDAIHDFAGKAAALARLRVPPDPSIVFFGAEAGWEAAILQALFGAGRRSRPDRRGPRGLRPLPPRAARRSRPGAPRFGPPRTPREARPRPLALPPPELLRRAPRAPFRHRHRLGPHRTLPRPRQGPAHRPLPAGSSSPEPSRSPAPPGTASPSASSTAPSPTSSTPATANS